MNRMKKSMYAWLLSVCMAVSAVPLPAMAAETDLSVQEIPIDEAHFPDENFREYVERYLDGDGDGKLSGEEQEEVTYISCSNEEISDLTGVKYFVNLDKLDCASNNLSSLDVSGCPALACLYCSDNNLSSLDVSGCPGLVYLECDNNNLSRLDVSGCPALMWLYCSSNNLSSLDVSGNPELGTLECSSNNLSSLDVSGNPALGTLKCSSNNLSSLDVSGCPALEVLLCSNNTYSMVCFSDNTCDLSKLPGKFDVSRAGNWQGGSVKGNILTVNAGEEQVTYTYDVDGSNGDKTAEFTLEITIGQDPAPHTHTYDAGKITKAATCKEEGVKTYTCTVCGETKTEAIAKLTTHSYDAGKVTKAATCKEEGVKTYTCTVCGETKTEAIAKLTTHSYDTGKVTQAATCKEEGVKTYTCTVCKGTKTEKIPKAEHTYQTTVVKATLKKDGKSTTDCKVCGKVKSTKVISHPVSITLKKASYTYDGKAKKPGVVVKDAAGRTIGSSNYTIKYEKGRKNIGKYKVTVTFKGNYSGTKSLSFTITPPAPKLSSVTAGSKKLNVKWKKESQATGYEIQYSTSKSFAKNAVQTVDIKNKSTVNKTITGLKAKKTYYVRIRAYKTVSGKKYYSAWSSQKKAVTKK